MGMGKVPLMNVTLGEITTNLGEPSPATEVGDSFALGEICDGSVSRQVEDNSQYG